MKRFPMTLPTFLLTTALLCGGAPMITAASRPTAMDIYLTARDEGAEGLKRLVDAGADLDVKGGPPFGDTALMIAADDGRNDILKLLLDHGARLEVMNDNGATALMSTLYKGRLESARLLLDRGANVNAVQNNGQTVLSLAANFGQAELAKFLIKNGADLDFAIVYLEGLVQKVPNDDHARAGLRMLERLSRESESERQPAALSKEDIKSIAQAAAEGAAQARKKETPPAAALASDVDKPAYRSKERPGDFAIVVGIGRYSEIPEAQFGERDGEAVKDHLYALGLPRRNVVHLTGEKAGYKGLEKFIEAWLPKNVSADSRVFFYFSGHGAPDPRTGETYLMPYDGDPNFLENTGYPLKRLYEKLGSLKVKEVLVVLDACFSGAGGRSVLAKGARPLVMKADAGMVPQNLTVFAAASGDQITSTLEDQGHGTFTYYFLKGLSGGAKDASGRVTAKALYDYLKPKVQDAARTQNRDQTPVLHGQGGRELVRF